MSGERGVTMAILQARTSSSRLPGKVLKEIAGEPMILRQLERLQRAAMLDLIVVATSDDASDDKLSLTVRDAGYDVARGPLEDVLARFIRAIDEYQPDNVVRLTADCPLISPSVIDRVVRHFHQGSADYVSNTMVPTFPDGLDVEVVTAEALRTVSRVSVDPDEHEHVTLGVYRRPETFIIENVIDPMHANHSHLRWTVDNNDDLVFVRAVYQRLLPHNPNFDYGDILELLDEHPELVRTVGDSARNTALNGIDTGVMQHRSMP